MATIGDRLKEARKAAKKTQAQVAKACGVSREAISQLESNGTKYPRPETLFKAADYLKIDPRQLVFGTNGFHARSPDTRYSVEPTSGVDVDVFTKAVRDIKSYLDDQDEDLAPEKFARVMWLVYDRYAVTGTSDKTAVQRYLKLVA